MRKKKAWDLEIITRVIKRIRSMMGLNPLATMN
jgi:hypothetical protein